MKYPTYLKLACKRFPKMNFDKIPQFNKIDCIKMVAEMLFICGDCDSVLAYTTRELLLQLRLNGELKDF